jgi:hypothetical protein
MQSGSLLRSEEPENPTPIKKKIQQILSHTRMYQTSRRHTPENVYISSYCHKNS